MGKCSTTYTEMRFLPKNADKYTRKGADYLLPCPACQGEQIAAGFLAQIEACKRDVAAWPDWMKQTATVPPWMASHATDL